MKTRFFHLFLLLALFVPVAVRGDEASLTIAGFPASTRYCALVNSHQALLKESMPDINGHEAGPLKGNIFVVVEFEVLFRSADAPISSKDFSLKKGDVQFECVGFAIRTAADKPPALAWGDEATLTAGGKENFARSHGRGALTLVFSGPTSYANGTLSVVSNYPVKPKTKTTPTPTSKGSKGKKKLDIKKW